MDKQSTTSSRASKSNDKGLSLSVRLYSWVQRGYKWADDGRRNTPPMSRGAKNILKVCGAIIIAGLVIYGGTFLWELYLASETPEVVAPGIESVNDIL